MKTSKRYLVVFALSALTFCNAQWWGNNTIKGDKDVITITRSTKDYEGIKCAGFMDFKLVKGTEGQLTLKGESNLLEYIITEVKDNTLFVKVKDGKNIKPSSNKSILITIPYTDIDHVSLSGSGDLWSDTTIYTKNFDTALAGSGEVNLPINSQSIHASIAGSGDLTLIGKTENLKTSVAGSGDFDGTKLDAINVDAAVSGSGDISLNCTDHLKARVSGSGAIEYNGNPKTEDTKVVGSGSISN